MNLKVYSLCGGRDAQQQVLKSLNDPDWPAQCDLTQAQGVSTRAAEQPRHSCSSHSSAPELNSARKSIPAPLPAPPSLPTQELHRRLKYKWPVSPSVQLYQLPGVHRGSTAGSHGKHMSTGRAFLGHHLSYSHPAESTAQPLLCLGRTYKVPGQQATNTGWLTTLQKLRVKVFLPLDRCAQGIFTEMKHICTNRNTASQP